MTFTLGLIVGFTCGAIAATALIFAGMRLYTYRLRKQQVPVRED